MQPIFYSRFLVWLTPLYCVALLSLVFESNPTGSGRRHSTLTGPQLLRGNLQPEEAQLYLMSPLFPEELLAQLLLYAVGLFPSKKRLGSKYRDPSFSFTSNTLISERSRRSAKKQGCSRKGTCESLRLLLIQPICTLYTRNSLNSGILMIAFPGFQHGIYFQLPLIITVGFGERDVGHLGLRCHLQKRNGCSVLQRVISYTSNKEIYESNNKPVIFFYVNLYRVPNLLMEIYKYHQTEPPFPTYSHYQWMNNSF